MKKKRLRSHARCSICAKTLVKNTVVRTKKLGTTVMCLPCHSGDAAVASTDTSAIDRGTPGASAPSTRRRRIEHRTQRLENAFGTAILGNALKKRDKKKRAEAEWAANGGGERGMSTYLNSQITRGVVLDDRMIPGHTGTVDHVVVAPSGVWLVATENYQGKVTSGSEHDLVVVNGEVRDDLIDDLHHARTAVIGAVAFCHFEGVPVHLAMCFVAAELTVLADFQSGRNMRQIKDIWVGVPEKVVGRITSRPATDPAHDYVELARRLAVALPAYAPSDAA